MIDAITFETAHLLGDALPSMYRLRYRLFVERQNYDVPCFRQMEWDQFDTPAAVYLLWRDEARRARGVARLIPTTFPYMIEKLWPQLIADGKLPSRDDVWELTRFGVDRDLDAAAKQRILGELVCGCLEYGLRHGIAAFLHVSHRHIINTVLVRPGCAVDLLGEPQRLGGFPVVAGRLHVTEDGLANVRRHTGLTGPVLRVPAEIPAQAA
ncbi:MAG: acyl-homoserine-lactone synthase [Rhodospirillales bacterium]